MNITTSSVIGSSVTANGSALTPSGRSSGRSGRTLLGRGALAGASAAVAVTGVVVATRAVGIPVAVDGQRIPIIAFAQLTLIATAIGVVLAAVLARRARTPQRTFTITAIALTGLSFLPDLLVDATAGSKLTLLLTHVVAAAIVVPAVAARLER